MIGRERGTVLAGRLVEQRAEIGAVSEHRTSTPMTSGHPTSPLSRLTEGHRCPLVECPMAEPTPPSFPARLAASTCGPQLASTHLRPREIAGSTPAHVAGACDDRTGSPASRRSLLLSLHSSHTQGPSGLASSPGPRGQWAGALRGSGPCLLGMGKPT